ncbi:protein bfr2-like [Nymphaea colorata]|nr:protein bfr2-like [Nymphaea colorata]
MRLKQRQLQKASARKHTSQFDPISLENFEDLEPWIEEEPTTIFDDENLQCFNLEAEAREEFVDEGEPAEYVAEDLQIHGDEDEEEDGDEDENEDDEDYE